MADDPNVTHIGEAAAKIIKRFGVIEGGKDNTVRLRMAEQEADRQTRESARAEIISKRLQLEIEKAYRCYGSHDLAKLLVDLAHSAVVEKLKLECMP